MSEIGGDYNDWDEDHKDDELLDDWDNKDAEDVELDDDDDDELTDDWDNEEENSGELDDDDDDEIPDDWDNENLDYNDLDDDDNELPDDWDNEDADNKDLDKDIDVKFPEDENREKIYDDRFNENKLNNKKCTETSRKTIIIAKNALHINSNEKFENEPNNISKDKLKEPINASIDAGERAKGNKKFDIPKNFNGLEPRDIMILHFLFDQNFEKLEVKEDKTPSEKHIQLLENSLTVENLKQGKGGLNLQKIPQLQEEIKEVSNEIDLSEIPQSLEELKEAETFEKLTDEIPQYSIRDTVNNLARMSLEQREEYGLPSEIPPE